METLIAIHDWLNANPVISIPPLMIALAWYSYRTGYKAAQAKRQQGRMENIRINPDGTISPVDPTKPSEYSPPVQEDRDV